MKRREFLKSVGLGVGGLALSGYDAFKKKGNFSGKKPNIIFIMADDLGYGELGSYGQKKIKTPNIDKLASEGMKFTNYYAGAPVCAPSRCVLLTGKHSGHAVVRDNYKVGSWDSYMGQYPLPSEEITISEMLKKAGYKTGVFGKWGLGRVKSSGNPLKQGFDRFFGYNCQRHAHNLYPRYLIDNEKKVYLKGNTRGLTGEQYAPQLIANEALKFVKENKNNPFFLYYATVLPHLPLQAPEKFVKMYKGKWEDPPYKGRSYLPNPNPRATYAAMITFLDYQVGRLVKLLDKLGIADNTIIFFTSDNGTTYLKKQVDYEFFKSLGPLRGYKGFVYEGGIRVPMIVRWPGKIKPSTLTHKPFAHYDIMATLAEVAGVSAPKNTGGISFLPILTGREKEQKNHEYLFWDFAGYGGQIAVRMGKWKGIKKNLRKNPDAPTELYNLEEDVGEKVNLSDKYPEIVKKIEKIMLEARTEPKAKEFRFWRYLK